MPRAFLALAVVASAFALVACGSDNSGGSTDIVVTVAAPKIVKRHIRCPGASECGRLEKLSVSDFNRPKNAQCTQQFGGDWKATVTGKLHGHPLAANFMLTDGCEIARWQRFAWLLGKRAPAAG